MLAMVKRFLGLRLGAQAFRRSSVGLRSQEPDSS